MLCNLEATEQNERLCNVTFRARTVTAAIRDVIFARDLCDNN